MAVIGAREARQFQDGLRLALVGLVGGGVVALLLLRLLQDDQALRGGEGPGVLGIGIYVIAMLSAALHLSLQARRGRASDAGWRWVGLGLALLAFASTSLVLAPNVVVPGTDASIAELLWALGLLPAVFGVAEVVRARVPQQGTAGNIDALLVAAGAFAIVVAGVSVWLDTAPIVGSDSVVTFTIVDLFLDVLALALALGGAQAAGWRPPLSVWIIAAAAATFTLTDAMYAVQAAHGTYAPGAWSDLGWPLGALLYAVAAHPRMVGRMDRAGSPSAQVTVPAAMIIASGILLVLPIDGPLLPAVRGSALLALGLSVFRMDRAVRSARGLAEQLRLARPDPLSENSRFPLVDALTGLPNRRAIRTRTPDEITGAVFVVFDLDGLGEINATFGTAIGDRVLFLTAQRLASSVRDTDVAARIGGDEFAVLLRGVDSATASRIAESLITKIEAEMSVQGHPVRISACAGVSTQAVDDLDIDSIISEAEVALRDAKRMGTGLVRSFTGVTGERSQDRLRLRAEIKEVFRRGGHEFVPFYQPIVDAHSGTILAVESLVRWRRGDKILAPGTFLPEVEISGSMGPLTRHMLRSALTELRMAGLDCPTTLNVPPDLVDAQLPGIVRESVRESGSEPAHLIIEITEDAIMRDPALAAAVLGELRRDGFRVLLDDFGTGWSGLSSLRDLVVDGLKLDGSFVQMMSADDTTTRIVRAVANLAEELGLLVIYEGVEDIGMVNDFPGAKGFVQGYAIARPMPIGDLATWVAGRSN